MTTETKRALYQRWYCNAKGEASRHSPTFDELDDDDFERMARLSRYVDNGAKVVIPGVTA